LITGISGAGKSSVGPLVAAKLGRPFVDLDKEIERKAGMLISEIFAQHGEDVFRTYEREALQDLSGWSDAVIALGAGALQNDENCVIASKLGDTVWLHVAAETAATRLKSVTDRPLLQEDAGTKLKAMLEKRAPYYGRAQHIVDGQGDIESVAGRVVDAAARLERVVVVRSHRGAYPVRVFHAEPHELALAISAHAGEARCVLICDRHVRERTELVAAELAKRCLSLNVLLVDAGESLKQLHSLEAMGLALEQLQADRNTVLVAIGGGSLTDAVGFLASCYRRGVRWISVPTTLLGMVDSSLGGKTGVNLGHAKNLLGAFYPPVSVLSDTSWLDSLDAREIRSGVAEMLKVAATHDVVFFEELTRLAPSGVEAVAKAAAIKATVVSDDEFEHGLRKVLNFGHTFGHAFESAGELKVLRHGEAIALGMLAETEFAMERGEASEEVLAALLFALQTLGLDENWRRFATKAKHYVGNDKKRTARHVRLAIVPKLGQFAWLDAEVSDLEQFLEAEGARV